jgi:ribose transport system substrate-binding protein
VNRQADTQDQADARSTRPEASRREALRLGALGASAMIAAPLVAACASTSTSSAGPAGANSATAEPTALSPYNPDMAGGTAPSLPKRLGFPNPYSAPLFLAVSQYLQQACDDRGIELLTAISNGDPETEVQQTSGFFQRGIGALFETPVNVQATNQQMLEAINLGALSVGVQRPDCHLQGSVNQYEIGYNQGSAAVQWIKTHLGGKAEVAYFNEDNSEPIIPRHHGVLAALKVGGPGITVVSDITAPQTTEGGANAMSTVLQAHPGVNVVMGDTGVMDGVFAAFQALGKANDPGIYLSSAGGTNFDLERIAEGTIFRATSAEPWNAWAYAIGQFAADWLDGKSIPRGFSALGGSEGMLTTPQAARQFLLYMSNPRSLWGNKTALAKYVSFYGNISYSTRANWWRETWTP